MLPVAERYMPAGAPGLQTARCYPVKVVRILELLVSTISMRSLQLAFDTWTAQ